LRTRKKMLCPRPRCCFCVWNILSLSEDDGYQCSGDRVMPEASSLN
jgi:hypothetical protein